MAKTGVMLRVFKTSMPSMSTILPNGKPVPFINGKHVTDDPYTIAHLDQAVKDKHPHIFIDPLEIEVDSGLIDPNEALRERIIQEYLDAQNAAAANPGRDMGTTDQSLKLNVANSGHIAEAAMGGSGARLLALQSQSAKVLEALPKAVTVTTEIPAATTLNAEIVEQQEAQKRFKEQKEAESSKAIAIQLDKLKAK